MNPDDRAHPDDPRWVKLMNFDVYTWHESLPGVSTYLLFPDRSGTRTTYTLVVERIDAGKTRRFGPFANVSTATDHLFRDRFNAGYSDWKASNSEVTR